MSTPPLTRSWRTRRSSRMLTAVFVLGICSAIAVDAVFVQRSEPYWAGGLLVLTAAVLVWLFAFRARLTLDGDEVIVRNPLRSRRFKLSEVATVEPGYSGVELHLRSGQVIRAWAVQKSNAAWMLGLRTRADAVAATLTECAEAARGDVG